ncbi:MAG TPA: ion transporter [Verrucomicrobiae bacterium]
MSDYQAGNGHEIGGFQLGLLLFTLLLLAALVVDTAFILPKEISNLVHLLDTFGCAMFFADFCYRFYRAERKLAFMKWGWVDLVACIPNLEVFRYARLARVLRVIRLLRGIRSLHLVASAVFQDKLRGGVTALVFAALLLVAFSSVSILVCERGPDANIKTAEDALWWSMSTITTVGYGDCYPKTTEGRAIGVILMVAGISIYGCLSGLAASALLTSRRKEADNAELIERLQSLEVKLDKLSQDHTNPQRRLVDK